MKYSLTCLTFKMNKLKTNTPEYRKNVIRQKLMSNHERVTKLGDTYLVKYAFLLNDPEDRTGFKEERLSLSHAELLKSLMRDYLNAYRKRKSGKGVLGYSWMLQSEAHRQIPYIHILFYLKADMNNARMPIKRQSKSLEATVTDSDKYNDVIARFAKFFQLEASEEVLSVVSDLGSFWVSICEKNGLKGACRSYNFDRDSEQLNHGQHRYIDKLNKNYISNDINGSHRIMSKLVSEVGDTKSIRDYFNCLSQEAYFLPNERSYGVSR